MRAPSVAPAHDSHIDRLLTGASRKDFCVESPGLNFDDMKSL